MMGTAYDVAATLDEGELATVLDALEQASEELYYLEHEVPSYTEVELAAMRERREAMNTLIERIGRGGPA